MVIHALKFTYEAVSDDGSYWQVFTNIKDAKRQARKTPDKWGGKKFYVKTDTGYTIAKFEFKGKEWHREW